MALPGPGGLWFSFINSSPGAFPNDGVVTINEPVDNHFTGYHYRQKTPSFDQTPIEGDFMPGAPDKITFRETYNGVTYTYAADIIEIKPTFFITTNGHRSAVAPAGTTDDDWVGTHTT